MGDELLAAPDAPEALCAERSLYLVVVLLLLLGMLGLRTLAARSAGALGWVATALVAVGLVAEAGGSLVGSVLNWASAEYSSMFVFIR